jgi:hypothetical protein
MSKADAVPTERDHHKKAFEVFFSLGDRRTYRAAATQLGVSVSSLKAWNRALGWAERISERDAEGVRQATARSMSDAVAETERNLKMIRAAKSKVMKDILEGKAKSASGDLAKFIQLEREIQGRPDPTASAGGQPANYNPVFILPDDHSYTFKPPVFALPDNGSAPTSSDTEGEGDDS